MCCLNLASGRLLPRKLCESTSMLLVDVSSQGFANERRQMVRRRATLSPQAWENRLSEVPNASRLSASVTANVT